jgi:diaminopimelate decarboxylase
VGPCLDRVLHVQQVRRWAGHGGALVPCTLTGPSCDSQDTILDQMWLPSPRAGDRVLIGNTGAYTTCYSGHSAFNGYPAPTIKITKTTSYRRTKPHTTTVGRKCGAGFP